MVDAIVEGFRRPQHPDQQCRPRQAPALRRDHARGLAQPDRRLPLRRHPLLPRGGAASRDRQERPHRQPSIGDSSRVGESGLAIVAAARAGVVALMKSLARELGRNGTTANTVSLGLVETAARQGMGRRQPREADRSSIRCGGSGRPGDVAPMVALLASPQSGWITGQVLSVSGGFSMV